MNQMFPVEFEENNAKGAYFVESHGKRIAELQWNNDDDDIIDVHHTFTDPSLRGKGVAGHLVKRVAQLAQKRDLKIRATCSYANKVLSSSEEYKSLLV